MAFKGTKNNTLGELQAFARKYLLSVNASTGPLRTTYQAIVIDRKMPFACEYLCDIYFKSIFPSAELEKEKKTVNLEIARRKDDDTTFAAQVLQEYLYRENPLHNPVVGTLEDIKRTTRSNLIAQKNEWHVPSNTIAIALGNVEHRDFVNQINKRIHRNYKRALQKEWSDEADILPLKREVTIFRPHRTKATLAIGCKLPRDLDERTIEAFSLFNNLIGRQPNSRLWDEVREKRGLAYVVNSSYLSTPGLGDYFSVYVEIDPSKSDLVKGIIWRSLLRPLSEKKKFMEFRDKMYDSFEIRKVEHEIINYEFLIWRNIAEGKPVKSVERDDERRLKIIPLLTLKDIEKVRKKFIRPERFVTVALKPSR